MMIYSMHSTDRLKLYRMHTIQMGIHRLGRIAIFSIGRPSSSVSLCLGSKDQQTAATADPRFNVSLLSSAWFLSKLATAIILLTPTEATEAEMIGIGDIVGWSGCVVLTGRDLS